MARPILVSACLLGIQTRYDGTGNDHAAVRDFLVRRDVIPIPVCPEQLAGLPTPRLKSYFLQGDGQEILDGCGEIVSEAGLNLNEVFLRGANETLRIARLTGCRQAVLKERSPSCGVHMVYRNDTRVSGQGVTAALLQRAGLHLLSEEDLLLQDGTTDLSGA